MVAILQSRGRWTSEANRGGVEISKRPMQGSIRSKTAMIESVDSKPQHSRNGQRKDRMTVWGYVLRVHGTWSTEAVVLPLDHGDWWEQNPANRR